MDEKEAYVIKTSSEGKPNFQVLSLEEPEDASAQGLKAALDNSISKQNFRFDRKDRQVGNGSDGAAVNNALYRIEKEKLGEHLVKGWCANHKMELGIHDAFNIYYLFKRANLKWRLFKKQAALLEMKCLKFKRPSGSRWVAHQTDSILNFLRKMPILLGFLHQNIVSPYNKSISDAKPILEGHLKSVSKLQNLLFEAAKLDILRYVSPFSQMLESNKLLAPEAISAMKNSLHVLNRVCTMMTEMGSACFYKQDLFPTLVELVWPNLQNDNSDAMLSVRRTRTAEDMELGDNLQAFHQYAMTTGLDSALKKVHSEVVEIVLKLEDNLKNRFSDFLESPIFCSAAALLNARSYRFKSTEALSDCVHLLENHFSTLLEANSCDRSKFDQEVGCLHTHVTTFLSKSTNEQIWQELFLSQKELAIVNILHLVEICLFLPISSVDIERVFSTFAKLLSKDAFL